MSSGANVVGFARSPDPPRPDGGPLRTVTVVVPTYREAENLPHLIDRIAAVRRAHDLDIDLLIMDDDSRDGSAELVQARPEPWVRLIVRASNHGLSQAVLDGMRRARHEVLVCMDADLSHPAEAIPAMLTKLEEGADFVVGSRYAEGGSTAHDWGFFRWLNSRVASSWSGSAAFGHRSRRSWVSRRAPRSTFSQAGIWCSDSRTCGGHPADDRGTLTNLNPGSGRPTKGCPLAAFGARSSNRRPEHVGHECCDGYRGSRESCANQLED